MFVQLLPKRYVTNENLANWNAEVRNIREGSMYSAEYAQELYTKTLRWKSVLKEKSVKVLFLKGVNYRIRKTIQRL